MQQNIMIFGFIAITIVVVARLALEFLQERDRARGIPIEPKEYKFSYILKTIIKDGWTSFKSLFKRKKKNEQKHRRK